MLVDMSITYQFTAEFWIAVYGRSQRGCRSGESLVRQGADIAAIVRVGPLQSWFTDQILSISDRKRSSYRSVETRSVTGTTCVKASANIPFLKLVKDVPRLPMDQLFEAEVSQLTDFTVTSITYTEGHRPLDW
jgi:hypothetical protein